MRNVPHPVSALWNQHVLPLVLKSSAIHVVATAWFIQEVMHCACVVMPGCSVPPRMWKPGCDDTTPGVGAADKGIINGTSAPNVGGT